MNLLAQMFPGHSVHIARLRSIDATFAEICRDYDALIGLLPRNAADPVLHDIRESLSGLEQEIRLYLHATADMSRNGAGTPETAAQGNQTDAC